MSKPKELKIAYEPHPVSPERKKELRAQGFRIVDAKFAPRDARPVPTPVAPPPAAPAPAAELPPPPAAKPQLGLPKNKA